MSSYHPCAETRPAHFRLLPPLNSARRAATLLHKSLSASHDTRQPVGVSPPTVSPAAVHTTAAVQPCTVPAPKRISVAFCTRLPHHTDAVEAIYLPTGNDNRFAIISVCIDTLTSGQKYLLCRSRSRRRRHSFSVTCPHQHRSEQKLTSTHCHRPPLPTLHQRSFSPLQQSYRCCVVPNMRLKDRTRKRTLSRHS